MCYLFIYLLFCTFSDSPTFEEFLRMLTLETLKHNSGLRRLDDVLASEHWNGKNGCFTKHKFQYDMALFKVMSKFKA